MRIAYRISVSIEMDDRFAEQRLSAVLLLGTSFSGFLQATNARRRSNRVQSPRLERERERERITENEKSVSILSSRIESRMHGKRGTRAWMRKINSADVTSWIAFPEGLFSETCVFRNTLGYPLSLSLNVI